MIGLTDTTHTLEVVTGAALNTDYFITYVDTTSAAHTPGSAQGTIVTATTTTVLSAPGASTYRGVKLLSLVNRGTSPQTITIQKDVSATNYILFYATLMPSEILTYSPEGGFMVHDRAGRLKTSPTGFNYTATTPIVLAKSMTAPESTSYHYCWSKDSGYCQGAWSTGSPGVNGRATDGTTSADYGCLQVGNAASGYQKYLTRWDGMSSVVHNFFLYDVLWVNTGLTVTTTTLQSITPVALPARDINGASAGEGCMIGMLVTTATTNVGAISGATVTYTNSGGTGSRTATLSAVAGFQIPPSAVIGTMVWFTLQAGDTGVQQIDGVTLGTSLVAGAISMVVARPLVALQCVTANQPASAAYAEPGVRIYDGSCILGGLQAGSGSAPAFVSTVYFTDK